jgi:hypothetical protein
MESKHTTTSAQSKKPIKRVRTDSYDSFTSSTISKTKTKSNFYKFNPKEKQKN